MEESLAYTLTNLVAEFGGYLGILMGVSILSLYDIIIYPIYKVFKLTPQQTNHVNSVV